MSQRWNLRSVVLENARGQTDAIIAVLRWEVSTGEPAGVPRARNRAAASAHLDLPTLPVPASSILASHGLACTPLPATP